MFQSMPKKSSINLLALKLEKEIEINETAVTLAETLLEKGEDIRKRIFKKKSKQNYSIPSCSTGN